MQYAITLFILLANLLQIQYMLKAENFLCKEYTLESSAADPKYYDADLDPTV